jgi:diguanylate cyclase (GGDEF)-like protein
MSQLDSNLRRFLHPFDIIKIKIYDTNRRIYYSTESALIGKTDDHNLRLNNALAGNVDAKMVTKEKARDLADEPLMDVDVVETYIPIRSEAVNSSNGYQPERMQSGKVLGSFEIYVNVTKYRDQIRTGLAVMTTLILAVLAAVFGFSYLLLRREALQLTEVQTKLEVLAITDVLTGIANRGYVMARGEEEFSRALRNNAKGPAATTLGCIMLDIDHFKHVNDTKGHPAGDEVLREVVERLRQSVRPYDIIGRYGGEEFLVLLPDTKFDDGVAVAERIRLAIRREPITIGGDIIRVSVSLGISTFDEKDQSIDDLLKRADEGLYKAKNTGRDRVEWVFNPLGAEAF